MSTLKPLKMPFRKTTNRLHHISWFSVSWACTNFFLCSWTLCRRISRSHRQPLHQKCCRSVPRCCNPTNIWVLTSSMFMLAFSIRFKFAAIYVRLQSIFDKIKKGNIVTHLTIMLVSCSSTRAPKIRIPSFFLLVITF